MTRPLDIARWRPWLPDRPGSVAPAVEPLTVTFPITRLVSRVQIALGADLSADPATWPWADITAYVRYDLGISLTVGRRDEASGVGTGRATLKLDNRDGRFSRRNPNSPYYGLLSKNTPIWATIDAGSGEKTRLEMFVNEWPTRWTDKSASDSTVTIQCAGIMRRLRQGEVFKSPLRRAALTTAPKAYWSLEDGSDATTAASALVGGAPMASAGTIDFAARSDLAGATAEPDMTAGTLTGTITGVSSTAWHVEFLLFGFASGAGATGRVYTNGALTNVWRIFPPATVGALFQVFIDDLAGAGPLIGLAVATSTDWGTNWHHVGLTASQSGGNMTSRLYIDGVLAASDTSAGTLGSPTSVLLNHQLASGFYMTSFAHVLAGDGATPTGMATAMGGYTGEQAHVRMARLCAEEHVLFTTSAANTATMGAQGIDSLLNLIAECAAADLGVLYEKHWGLAYKSRHEFYNQTAGLALDFNSGHIADLPEPADDDQRTRNRWTVARADGTEETAEKTTGPMGTGSGGPGLYDDSVTLNLGPAEQLAEYANWLVHVGTADEDRWPSIGLNFLAKPELIDAWTALGYGARITVAHPPTQMPPDDLDLIVEGHTEWWDGIEWRASLNCSPASVYRVAIVEDPAPDQNIPRVGSGTAVLAASYTSSDVSFSVTTGAGGLWTTDAADFPLDINISGERIRLSAISGAADPQTFNVSARSVNGITKAQTAGARVEPWQTAVVGL